jgi:hypothetical protein
MKSSKKLIKASAVMILDLNNTLVTSIFFWHIKTLNMITLNERTNKRKNWKVSKSDLLSVKQTKIIIYLFIYLY